jgi:hypothetical protein
MLEFYGFSNLPWLDAGAPFTFLYVLEIVIESNLSIILVFYLKQWITFVLFLPDYCMYSYLP